MRGILALVSLVLVVAGCGGDGGELATDHGADSSAAPEVETMTVSGELKVDAVAGVKVEDPSTGECVALGELGKVVNIGKSPLVVRAPDGREVALAEITGSEAPTYIDNKDGLEYFAVGLCKFRFEAVDVEVQPGIYTVAVPELNIEERFESTAPTSILMKFDAYGTDYEPDPFG